MSLYDIKNSNRHSQAGVWEQGRSPVGCDCYHTILHSIFKIKFQSFFMTIIGAMAIAPYGFYKNKKHDNMPYFSHKIFFNVKILKTLGH